MMTSRERVVSALAHRENEVPLDIGGSIVTSIAACTYERLLRLLGIDAPVCIRNIHSQTAEIDEAVFEALGVDTRPTDIFDPSGFRIDIITQDGIRRYRDEWGITYSMPVGGQSGFTLIESPLARADSIGDIEGHDWPDGTDGSRFAGLQKKARDLAEVRKVGVILETNIGGVLEWPCALRGTENFYMDLADNAALAEALIEKVVEYKIDFWTAALRDAGEYVDIVRESDDLGGQRGLLISPDMYRRYIKPAQKRIFDTIRRHTDAAISLHSCGSIKEIIPDLIEIGVTVLNPVQIGAYGMDPETLKREFGKDLVFWGGGCDSQKVLPYASPEQVKDSVKRSIEVLSRGGGYICAPINMIQNDVPAENIIAFAEAVAEWRE